MLGIGAVVKYEKLVWSDLNSLCQKDGPRLGSLQRELCNSDGMETLFEMDRGRLPGCQLKLQMVLAS